MAKIIKDFNMFLSGSFAYNISRKIKSEEDIIQLLNEVSIEYRKHINKLKKV